MRFDVCIVGGGTLGLYLATRLALSGKRVALVEAGTASEQAFKEGLQLGPAGFPKHRGALEGWTSGLGGTSQWWGGQLWPWEEHEFEARPVLGIDPWPPGISAQVRDAYPTVIRNLGLSTAHQEIHEGVLESRRRGAALRAGRTRHSSWMSRTERRFDLNSRLGVGARHCTTFFMTTLAVESKGRGWLVVGRQPEDVQTIVEADHVVLAAGTLGNVSILGRSSLAPDLAGLGSGFMDHVSAPVAEFEIVDPDRFRRAAAPLFHRGAMGSVRLLAGNVPSNVLPAYGHWEISPPDWVPLAELKGALAARRMGPVLRASLPVGRHLPQLAESLVAAAATRHRPVLGRSRVRLRVDVQQPARPQNRLIPRGNALEVSWMVGDSERHAIRVHSNALVGEIDETALGARLIRRIDSEPEDIFHMMGGTAMGPGGVATAEAQVVGAPNLHLAGAGLFPNGGMANPTLTALCLAENLVARIEGN